MHEKAHFSPLWLTLGVFTAIILPPTRAAEAWSGDSAVVTVPQAANLEQTLRELRRATGKAIIAEIPQVERRLTSSLRQTPVPDALSQISRSFHLLVADRAGALTFMRRFADPKEQLDLEVEELEAISTDVHRLMRPFAPAPPRSTDYSEFVASLSEDELRIMRTEGLPFDRLTGPRRHLWTRLSAWGAYGSTALAVGYVSGALSRWKSVELRGERNGSGSPYVRVSYPDTNGPGDLLLLPSDIRPRANSEHAAVYSVPASRRRLPRSFQQHVTIPGGVTTLSALIEALQSATGDRITFPAYAGTRRLIVFVDGVKAEEILTVLQDMYGWEFGGGDRRRYSLGRPRITPARDAFDLHRKLHAAVPPIVRRVWSAEGQEQSAARVSHHTTLVLRELELARKPGLTRTRIVELDPQLSRRIANLVFYQELATPLGRLVNRGEPQAWLVTPERGRFVLRGQTDPAKQPILQLRVQRPDGAFEGWGWFVGSEGKP